MEQNEPSEWYYWQNYQFLIGWVLQRYADLLLPEEKAFCTQYQSLPRPSQALLVRLLMRKGLLFRAGKLHYAEIGDTATAMAPLITCGWVECDPMITVEDLWRLLLKQEVASYCGLPKTLSKAQSLPLMLASLPAEARWSDSVPADAGHLYQLNIQAISDVLRLMFFGNLYQDLTEFVITDLGIMRYEAVDFPIEARAFQHRQDVDTYLQLQQCAALLDAQDWDGCRESLPDNQSDNPWLQRRRDKLCYRLAYQLERQGALDDAMQQYQQTAFPGSQIRQIRILAAQTRDADAWVLWQKAMDTVETEADRQTLERMAPRLAKKVGETYHRKPVTLETQTIQTTALQVGESVEMRAAQCLATADQPVYFVENSLINGLFGLWCWPAIFAPVQGAFFHPYQLGPADLHQPDFVPKRAALFDTLWQQLASTDGDNSYQTAIRQRYEEKMGIANPFVNWSVLTPELLELGLACLSPQWLEALFRRMLADIRANRSGFPDLVQFDLVNKDATFIEVKGPGDTLQDNQRRWMAVFEQVGIPHWVCHVRW